MQKGKPFCTVVGNADWSATVESSVELPQKIKTGSAFYPRDPTSWGIYPKELKTLIQKNISIPMFIAALFTIAKIWKQPKCPSIAEWIMSG